MSDPIRINERGGVLSLAFNRPEKKNAITNAMYETLTRELKRAESEPSIRVVLFEAEGDMFTAGNDLAEFAAVARGEKPASSLAAYPFILALAQATKPLVAAVQGNAVGIGLTMLLHCDVVFIAEDAKLTAPFVDLALVPEAAASLLLPARIGYPRTYAIFALGEALDGRAAEALGLVTKALPANEVQVAAQQAAVKLAGKSPASLKATKSLMRDTTGIIAATEREKELFAAQLKTPEAKEAFEAFAGKRKPDFKN